MAFTHKTLFNSLLWIALILFAGSCANPIAPEGGAKDLTPPKIDSTRSSTTATKNFVKNPIQFRFNEWVVMENMQTQMVVSPPLTYPPKVALKGKTLVFNFDTREELKANTTYSINFGESIKDLTEGNPAKNLRYVFSTGEEIDSASLFSTVKNSFTKETVKDALVMLYDTNQDSVILKQKPDYFAKTSETGTFTIQNIRPGTYKVFALKDDNFNYLYDLDTELIGFTDTSVVIGKNEQKSIAAIEISKESKPPRLIEKKSDRFGLVQCAFIGDPNLVNTEIQVSGQSYISEIDKDSLKIWYKPEPTTDWQVIFDNGLKKDTVFVKPGSAKEDKRRKNLKLLSQKAFFNKRITSSQTIQVDLTNPIVKIDTAKILVITDTSKQSFGKYFELKKEKPRALFLNGKWKDNVTYKMLMLPGSVTDLFGNTNDTIKADWKVLANKELGNISIHLNNLTDSKTYFVQLLSSSGEVIVKYSISGKIKWETFIPNQLPGGYELVIVEDLNNNSKWDPVSLFPRRKAETIFRKKPEPLRPNWELDINISF